MKTLIALALISFSALSQAQDSNYELCTSGDRSFLQAATVIGNEAVMNLVKSDAIENEVSCVVSRPNIAHPAVCGYAISNTNTYVIETKTGASYTIVANLSYTSCSRVRAVPTILKLTYTPSLKPVYFP